MLLVGWKNLKWGRENLEIQFEGEEEEEKLNFSFIETNFSSLFFLPLILQLTERKKKSLYKLFFYFHFTQPNILQYS